MNRLRHHLTRRTAGQVAAAAVVVVVVWLVVPAIVVVVVGAVALTWASRGALRPLLKAGCLPAAATIPLVALVVAAVAVAATGSHLTGRLSPAAAVALVAGAWVAWKRLHKKRPDPELAGIVDTATKILHDNVGVVHNQLPSGLDACYSAHLVVRPGVQPCSHLCRRPGSAPLAQSRGPVSVATSTDHVTTR